MVEEPLVLMQSTMLRSFSFRRHPSFVMANVDLRLAFCVCGVIFSIQILLACLRVRLSLLRIPA